MESSSGVFVYFMLRVILGSLFFFQAYDKIVRLKLSTVNEQVNIGAAERKIPAWFTHLSVVVTSYIELFGGFLLMLGLFTSAVSYLFGIHLIVLVVAFSYLKGVWDMSHVFPRIALLTALLLLPESWNLWSIDHIL